MLVVSIALAAVVGFAAPASADEPVVPLPDVCVEAEGTCWCGGSRGDLAVVYYPQGRPIVCSGYP